jgi:hypothetical protein
VRPSINASHGEFTTVNVNVKKEFIMRAPRL